MSLRVPILRRSGVWPFLTPLVHRPPNYGDDPGLSLPPDLYVPSVGMQDCWWCFAIPSRSYPPTIKVTWDGIYWPPSQGGQPWQYNGHPFTLSGGGSPLACGHVSMQGTDDDGHAEGPFINNGDSVSYGGGFGTPGAGIAISVVCASGNPLGNADPHSVQGISAALWIENNGYAIGARKTKTMGGSGSLSGSLNGHAVLGWPFFYSYDWTCEVEG